MKKHPEKEGRRENAERDERRISTYMMYGCIMDHGSSWEHGKRSAHISSEDNDVTVEFIFGKRTNGKKGDADMLSARTEQHRAQFACWHLRAA